MAVEPGEALARCAILFGVELVETLAAKNTFTRAELAALANALDGSGGPIGIQMGLPANLAEWRGKQSQRVRHLLASAPHGDDPDDD